MPEEYSVRPYGLNAALTSAFDNTTIAQIPNGIPKMQQGLTQGIIAAMAPVRANPRFFIFIISMEVKIIKIPNNIKK